MPDFPPTFRDFGFPPEGFEPPDENILAFFSTGVVVGQYIATGLVSSIGLALAVLFVLTLPQPLNWLGGAAALATFAAFAHRAIHNDYRWIELDGQTLRARHLYTGRTIERGVDEIESIRTLVPVDQASPTKTHIAEKVLGQARSVEILFRDRRTPIRISRIDPAMINAKGLIMAILYRMRELGELNTEIITYHGKPLLRSIHREGEQLDTSSRKNRNTVFCCISLLTFSFGAILGYLGLQEQDRRAVGILPLHEITLQALIQNGPGTNRHVAITDFQAGGYTVESKYGSWSKVWIALFPLGMPRAQATQIPAVFSSNYIRNETELQQLLKTGHLTGICSKTPDSNWGMTLGPNLVQANEGRQLTSAWSIDDIREPPSAAQVAMTFNSSAGCLAVAIVFGIAVLWKAYRP